MERMMRMKTVEVVAAIIIRGSEVFIAKRGRGEYTDVWEFPGGKVGVEESPRAALKRQIKNTLDLEVDVGKKLCVMFRRYSTTGGISWSR